MPTAVLGVRRPHPPRQQFSDVPPQVALDSGGHFGAFASDGSGEGFRDTADAVAAFLLELPRSPGIWTDRNSAYFFIQGNGNSARPRSPPEAPLRELVFVVRKCSQSDCTDYCFIIKIPIYVFIRFR